MRVPATSSTSSAPTDGLHPDFGGLDPDVVNGVYGMPFVVVGADQPKVSVVFDYDEESDGVNHATGRGLSVLPFRHRPLQNRSGSRAAPREIPGPAAIGTC